MDLTLTTALANIEKISPYTQAPEMQHACVTIPKTKKTKKNKELKK